MENVNKTSKFANGAIILTLCALICKIVGAFYRIPLSNILGTEGIGVYQLVFPIYSLFLVFSSGGIAVSLSKIVAACHKNNEFVRSKRFLLQAIIFLILVSLLFSSFFIFFGKKIAIWQGNSFGTLGYYASALAIVFASVLTAFRGYFQGCQNMVPTAISQLLEQVFKLFLGLLFSTLLIKNGVNWGVFGAMSGVAVSEIIAFFYLLFLYIKKRGKADVLEPENKTKFWGDFLFFLKQTFPIMLGSIVLPFVLAVDSFLVVNLLSKTGLSSVISTKMFGIYSGMVCSLINFPTAVSVALSTSLVPAISSSNENKNFGSIFKILLFISVPCMLFFFAFSGEIIKIVFPSTNFELFEIASTLLKICSINVFYISLLQITTAIMQAKNKSFGAFFNLIIAGIIKVVLTIFAVQTPLLIYGAAIASTVCYAISSGLNVILLKSEIEFGISKKSGFIVLCCSVFSLAFSIGVLTLLKFFISNSVAVLLSIIFAGIFYVFLCLMLPVFSNEELVKIPFGKKIVLLKAKYKKRKTGNN